MKHIIAIALLALAALVVGCAIWNQPVTKIDSDSPLALHCSKTTWCDRRTERCKPPTADRPDGYCEFVGDDGRAFSKRLDGGTE